MEDANAAELNALWNEFLYDKESDTPVDEYSVASEQSFGENWLLKQNDELQRFY